MIVSVTIFTTSLMANQIVPALLLACLAGALIGFLRFNFHPARIFLGDSGSLLIGFLIAVVSIEASNKLSTAVALSAPILALGLPILDTGVAVVRRAAAAVGVRRLATGEGYEYARCGGGSLFEPDRRHLHHRLLDLGFSHSRTVLVLYGVSLALVVLREPDQGFILGAFVLASMMGIRRLGYGEIEVVRGGKLLPIFDLPLANRRIFHVLVDLVFVFASLLGALWIANEAAWESSLRDRFVDAIPGVAFAQIAAFTVSGLYRRSFRYSGVGDVVPLARALLLAGVAGWLARFVARGFVPPSIAVTVLDGFLLASLAERAAAAGVPLRRFVTGWEDVLPPAPGGGGRAAIVERSGRAAAS